MVCRTPSLCSCRAYTIYILILGPPPLPAPNYSARPLASSKGSIRTSQLQATVEVPGTPPGAPHIATRRAGDHRAASIVPDGLGQGDSWSLAVNWSPSVVPFVAFFGCLHLHWVLFILLV